MNDLERVYRIVAERIQRTAERTGRVGQVSLLAVSKSKPAALIRELAALGQRAFGENYVQEALAKQRGLADLALQWHFIGALQSNKCKAVAEHFDWVQSVDRAALISPLARHRPKALPPVDVLIQVNIDGEASKSGCRPEDLPALAAQVAAQPQLLLRGLMGIPAPDPDFSARRRAFRGLRALFESLQRQYPAVDTLSMGMSEDFELAIEEGATLVRVGSALFGPRNRPMESTEIG